MGFSSSLEQEQERPWKRVLATTCINYTANHLPNRKNRNAGNDGMTII